MDPLEDILILVEDWAGSREAALTWCRTPLPSFGGVTPECLVRQGRVEAVRRYIQRIAAGLRLTAGVEWPGPLQLAKRQKKSA